MEVQEVVLERNPIVMTSKNFIDLKDTSGKTAVICGWCGAREQLLGNGRTECPNCDEYLD